MPKLAKKLHVRRWVHRLPLPLRRLSRTSQDNAPSDFCNTSRRLFAENVFFFFFFFRAVRVISSGAQQLQQLQHQQQQLQHQQEQQQQQQKKQQGGNLDHRKLAWKQVSFSTFFVSSCCCFFFFFFLAEIETDANWVAQANGGGLGVWLWLWLCTQNKMYGTALMPCCKPWSNFR